MQHDLIIIMPIDLWDKVCTYQQSCGGRYLTRLDVDGGIERMALRGSCVTLTGKSTDLIGPVTDGRALLETSRLFQLKR